MNHNDSQPRNIRQARKALDAVLDRMDHQADGAGHAEDERLARRYPRRRYRLVITAELDQPGGTVLRYAVATRNISRSGMSFLIGQFVYPGNSCRLHLISPHNYAQLVTGRIVRCNYLVGTGSLHEVGVQFNEAIDATLFQEGGDSHGRARVLIADDDETMHQLYKAYLKELQVDLDFVKNGTAAISAAKSTHYDLVLMDIELPELDGLAATRELRGNGYMQPIIALTALHGEKPRAESLEAGCTSFVTKPVSRDVLVRLVHGVMYEPLESTFAGDPEMTEPIDTFVADLPNRIRALEQAFDDNDLEALEHTIRVLKGQGASFGFDVITETATELENSLRARPELAAIREGVSELLKWCRARPATEPD